MIRVALRGLAGRKLRAGLTALAIVLGIGLAALVTRRLSEFSTSEGGEGMTFSIPLLSLAVFVVIAVVAGIVAAILPARRASRLRILDALHYE